MKALHRFRKFSLLFLFLVENERNSLFRSAELDRMHNENTEKFIECIKTSRDVCGENNLVAIKVTALVQPSVLNKFNKLLQTIENRSSLPSIFELINRTNTNEKSIDSVIESSFLTNQVNSNKEKIRFLTFVRFLFRKISRSKLC